MPDWTTAACRPNEAAVDEDGNEYTDIDGEALRVPRTAEFFHDERGQLDVARAKAICAGCPLTGIGGTCLDWAMDNERDTTNDHGWRSGVAGGFAPGERVQLALSHPRYALHPTEPSDLEVDVIVREMTDGRDQGTGGGEGEAGSGSGREGPGVHHVRLRARSGRG